MRTIKTVQATLQEPTGHADQSWSSRSSAGRHVNAEATSVFVIDSDAESRESLRRTLEAHAFNAQAFSDSQTFLTRHHTGGRGCILVDVSTPGADSIEFIRKLKASNCSLSVIAIATRFAPARVIEAVKAGASDCLDRPFTDEDLVSALERVLEESDAMIEASAFRSLAIERVQTLSARQRQVLELITAGHPSKNIAADLNISQRTVENHRAAIAKKTCSRSLADVVHTAICASCVLKKARH